MEEQIDLSVFIKNLCDDDDDAWLLLRGKVKDFLKKNKKFSDVLNKTSHPDDEFVNALIVHLKEDNKRRLKECKIPEAFWGWLNRVEQTVLDKLTCSKEELDSPGKDFDEGLGRQGDNPSDVAKAKESYEREMVRRDSIERLQITRTSFVKLWKENPQSAFIMFARFELDVSSKDVGALLGITTNHIDVTVNRTREKLRDEESKLL